MKALKAFLSVVLLSVTAFLSSAQSTRVDSVSFDVRLQDDGSAFVTEVWSMYAGSEGTEMYQPHYYLRQGDVEMDIAGLAVSDETGRQFVSEGKGWDTNRSRRAKEGRCGLVPVNDGYEICWGLGATGQREYTVTYTLTGLVKAYDDCDGFNYTFLAPGQGVPPRSFSLRIVKAMEPLTDENTGIWGFGSHSDLFFQDGEIRARSTEAFRSSNYLTLVVQFDKGLFEPAVTAGGSFDAVLDKAREGSEYKEDKAGWRDFLPMLMFALFFLGSLLLSVVGVLYSVISRKRLRRKLLGGSEKDVEWFRGTPVGGDLKKASNILSLISDKDNNQNLISAYITRLFYKGAFELVPDAKGNLQLKVNEFPEPSQASDKDDLSLEYRIYGFFKSAAGDDSILQKKELRKWASRNGKSIYGWQKDVPDGSTLKTLDAGEVRQVYGLKKFLKDFTLIPDRGVVEVALWNDYLTFASLYGIADQVYKDFKKVCPEYFELSRTMRQFQSGTDFAPVVIWDYIGDASRYFNNAGTGYAVRHMGSSRHSTPWTGGGGTMSWGGGGGSFGGGFGGGVR